MSLGGVVLQDVVIDCLAEFVDTVEALIMVHLWLQVAKEILITALMLLQLAGLEAQVLNRWSTGRA
ncbi:hypothetical protein [Arcanobacterium canis]